MKDSLSEKVEIYNDEIILRNCRSFRRFTFGGLWITGTIVLIGYVMSAFTEFLLEYLVFFLYFCALYAIARYCDHRKTRWISTIYYLGIAPIMAGGILMGTIFDPDQPALTIMVLQCTMMMFITDKPWKVIGYQILVSVAFAICCYYAKDSHWFWADMVDMAVYTCVAIGVNFFALRERIEAAENYLTVREKSEMDALTGLLNRGSGEEKVAKLLREGAEGAFVILDVDNFKQVNDNFGHENGDEVLRQVSVAIQCVFRPSDVMWRMGGDEFAIFAPGLIDQELCKQRFERLQSKMSEVILNDQQSIFVGMSIGCVFALKERENTYDELYSQSDKALYQAKENGKNTYVFMK